MRSNQSLPIAAHLTAANLFGFQPEKQLPVKTLVQPLQSPVEFTAVYPAVHGPAFARTMDKFRVYVSDYNFRTIAENEVIEAHNAKVQIYKKENQLAEYQKQILVNFPKKHRRCNAREYNQAVDDAGEAFSYFIEKKTIPTIKYATEQHFQNFMHLYNMQLKKRNEEYMRLKVRVPRPLQELDTNSYHITTLNRNGVSSIDVCAKTVRNHRQRLVEAGIFQNATSHGHTKGVTVTVNPDILAILDLQHGNPAMIENQPLSPTCKKEFPYNNETTRANLDNYKKREAASQASCDKEAPTSPAPFVHKSNFHKNTLGKEEKNSLVGAAENVKVEEILSHQLRALIIHPQQLAMELSQGLHDNYVPIDVRLLHKEAYGGYLTRSEFRELVIQDHFKAAAKLYRGANVYPGSWKRAINEWMSKKFLTFNDIEFQKANVVSDVEQLRWRLDDARKFFIRTGIPTLYPSRYFDCTRQTSKEIGFEYTKKRWARHLKYIEQEPERKRKQQKNAQLRIQQINYSKMLENELRRFLKDKITWPQLSDYVEKHLPAEYAEKLPEMLDRLMTTLKR